jgi:hypothetical protein
VTSISTRVDQVFGNHAHVTVFIGPDSDHRASAGRLVCRLEEIEEQEHVDAQARLHEFTEAYTARVEIIGRVWELLEHARKVTPSERAVIYAADLRAALDGVDRDRPRKTGMNDAAQEGQRP